MGTNQETQQSIPYVYSNPYGTGHAQSIIQMTSTHEEIEALRLSLLRAEKVQNKIEFYGKPLLNDKGINSIIGQIKSLVHRITIMSNMDEEEIRRIMLSFTDSMILDLMTNRTNYEIERSYDRTKILRMAFFVAYSCIKRSIYGDDKKLWGTVHHEMNNFITQQSAPNQSWYSKLNPFKR